jgi:hypothetical protein
MARAGGGRLTAAMPTRFLNHRTTRKPLLWRSEDEWGPIMAAVMFLDFGWTDRLWKPLPLGPMLSLSSVRQHQKAPTGRPGL